jgi:hypothetical protein
MSKRKDKRSDIVLERNQKTFWYRSQICFIENRWFRYGPESALLDQIEMISFNETNSGTFVELLWNVCGTFVERLWNICRTFVLLLF